MREGTYCLENRGKNGHLAFPRRHKAHGHVGLRSLHKQLHRAFQSALPLDLIRLPRWSKVQVTATARFGSRSSCRRRQRRSSSIDCTGSAQSSENKSFRDGTLRAHNVTSPHPWAAATNVSMRSPECSCVLAWATNRETRSGQDRCRLTDAGACTLQQIGRNVHRRDGTLQGTYKHVSRPDDRTAMAASSLVRKARSAEL